MKNELTVQLEKSHLDKEKILVLQNSFNPFFDKAKEWTDKANLINVTDTDQVDEIAAARSARLALKKIRVEVENVRKNLKDGIVREGKAIDGLANAIKFLIVPSEMHLQTQEDFPKIQEQKRKDEIKEIRENELAEFDIEDTSSYNLAVMSEEAYNQLLSNSKVAFNLKKDAEKKIELERIAKEKAEIEERARIKKENEQLRAEADKRERIANIEKLKQEKIQADKDKIIADERKKRERLEQEKKDRDEAEQKEKDKADEIEKAKVLRIEKEKRILQLAPDKQKLSDLALRIDHIGYPELKDDKAKQILQKAVKMLNEASSFLKESSLDL